MSVPVLHHYRYDRRLPHMQKAGHALFVTFCRLTDMPFPPKARDRILGHCLHDNDNRYTLHATVVMPEHVHLLLTPLADAAGWPFELHKIMRLIKGSSARSVNQLLGAEGPVWEEESFDHVLRSDESLLEKADYIRQNPVRRGLVSRAEDYPWLWLAPNLAARLV